MKRGTFINEIWLYRINTQFCLRRAALTQRLSKGRIDCLWRSAVAQLMEALDALACAQPVERSGIGNTTAN
jgi:hypothetical protein